MKVFTIRQRKDGTASLDDILSRLDGATSLASGELVTPKTAMAAPTVFSVVNLVRRTLGQLPIDVVKMAGKNRQPQPDHPVAKLLSRPNTWQTAYQFKAMIGVNLLLWGNYYAHKQTDGMGSTRYMVPITPGAVAAKMADDYSILYTVTTNSGSREVKQNRMMHVRDLTEDAVIGVSPVSRCAEAIGMEIASQGFAAQFFGGGALPGGVIEHPTQFRDEESRTRFSDSWRKLFGKKGTDRGGTAVLEGGLKYNTIQATNKDSQMLEARNAQREIIAGLFGIPPHMVGALNRATFNNIEHMSLEYVIYFLTPLLTNIEQQMAFDLLSEEEQETHQIKFNVGGLLRGDRLSRTQSLAVQRQNGIINADEWRAIEDMNPLGGDEGETYLTPVNMAPAGTVATPASTQPGAPDPAPPPVRDTDETE